MPIKGGIDGPLGHTDLTRWRLDSTDHGRHVWSYQPRKEEEGRLYGITTGSYHCLMLKLGSQRRAEPTYTFPRLTRLPNKRRKVLARSSDGELVSCGGPITSILISCIS